MPDLPGFVLASLATLGAVTVAVVLLWPRMAPYVPRQQEARLAAIEADPVAEFTGSKPGDVTTVLVARWKQDDWAGVELPAIGRAAVHCPGPLIWYDVTPDAILLCNTCGYLVTTNGYSDQAHADTSVMREGLGAW